MHPAKTADAQIDSPVHSRSESLPQTNSTFALPIAISLPILLVVGGIAFAVLNNIFPVFVIAQELLAQMPPDGVAKVREIAFGRCRLTNTLLAVSVISLTIAILLPTALIFARRLQHSAFSFLIPRAVVSSLVACLGVLLGHAVMELTTSYTLGMTRTFLAHWFEFGLFGVAIGLSVGLATGDRKLVADACMKGLITGLISATVFDLASIVMPRARLDALIPGGVLWGSHDATLIAMWVAFLILPLAIGLRSLGPKLTK